MELGVVWLGKPFVHKNQVPPVRNYGAASETAGDQFQAASARICENCSLLKIFGHLRHHRSSKHSGIISTNKKISRAQSGLDIRKQAVASQGAFVRFESPLSPNNKLCENIIPPPNHTFVFIK